MSLCANCSRADSVKICSACKCTYYCGTECQRKHWSTHKKECKLLSKKYNREKPKPKANENNNTITEIKKMASLHTTKTLDQRLNILKQISDHEIDSSINILWKIYSNILNDPFNISSRYKQLQFNQIKKQFAKYPVFIDLLKDAGFRKSQNGKKLIFDMKYMKLLKNANKALNKKFSFFGQFNCDNNDYNFDKRDSQYSTILDQMEVEMKEMELTDANILHQSNYLLIECDPNSDHQCHVSGQIDGGCYINQLMGKLKKAEAGDILISQLKEYIFDEEYDTDSFVADLDDKSQSNIFNTMMQAPFASLMEIDSVLTAMETFIKNNIVVQCPCLTRMKGILKRYDEYIRKRRQSENNDELAEENIFEAIYGDIDGDYDNVAFLNDSNHLTMNHSGDFECVVEALVKGIAPTIYPDAPVNEIKLKSLEPCDLSKCLLMKR
eukprot:442776_1